MKHKARIAARLVVVGLSLPLLMRGEHRVEYLRDGALLRRIGVREQFPDLGNTGQRTISLIDEAKARSNAGLGVVGLCWLQLSLGLRQHGIDHLHDHALLGHG